MAVSITRFLASSVSCAVLAALVTWSVGASAAETADGDGLEMASAGLKYANDSEYRWNWANAAVKAGDANGRGWTGAGQTVAVFDTGIAAVKEFSGRLVTGYDAIAGKVGAPSTDPGWHGTFVAGLIGAARDGTGMEGVAYDSKLLAIRMINADGRVTLSDKSMAAGIIYATGKAGVFNNSWNSSATARDVSAASMKAWYGQSIAAWQNAVRQGAIVVFAAGNDGKSDPGVYAALPTFFSDLKKGWVAAVATDSSGRLASWSNRCGASADWCLAAPGASVISTWSGGGYAQGSGTSFAAPVISGGAALLKQEWPYLGNDQILAILFRTANKSGIYANRSLYGQGMMDLEAATRPVGTVSVPTSSGKVAVASSATVTSAAFGAALARNSGQVTVLDEYNRNYQTPLSGLVAASATPYDLEKGLGTLGGGLTRLADMPGLRFAVADTAEPTADTVPRMTMTMGESTGETVTVMHGLGSAQLFGGVAAELDGAGLLAKEQALSSAYLGLAGRDGWGLSWSAPAAGGTRLTVASLYGSQADHPTEWERAFQDPTRQLSQASVAAIAARLAKPAGGGEMAITAGMVDERNTVLGSASEGALALGSGATTWFAGIGGQWPLGSGLSLFAGWEAGRTQVRAAQDSLISGLSALDSQAGHVGIAKTGVWDSDDRLAATLSQPLRVTAGSAALSLPTGMDADGTLRTTSERTGLAADGHETDLQVGYQTPLDDGESMTMAALLRLQPDNVRDAAPEMVVMGRYRLAF